jgi:hypothetical protein
MEFEEQTDAKQLLASLSPETLGSLADLIVSKLRALDSKTLLSKQVVTGSNPVSRSIILNLILIYLLLDSFYIITDGKKLVKFPVTISSNLLAAPFCIPGET